jgi:hypothetical protein
LIATRNGINQIKLFGAFSHLTPHFSAELFAFIRKISDKLISSCGIFPPNEKKSQVFSISPA